MCVCVCAVNVLGDESDINQAIFLFLVMEGKTLFFLKNRNTMV